MLSLETSHFGNCVSQLTNQFITASLKITSAMLPALTASVRLRDMVRLPTRQLMDETKEVDEETKVETEETKAGDEGCEGQC